jgi:methionyl-tRNA formyltransferase
VSLLPEYRGAAPIQRVVLDGREKTGVTIMQMDEGLDTGPILLQKEILMDPKETSGSLHDKLAILGAEMIIDYLTNHTNITPIPQPMNDVSYANKIEKLEAKINWSEEASIIERKIRGFNPFPGCFSSLDGQLIKIWAADVVRDRQSTATPGSIIEASRAGISVACGEGTILSITELQDAGRNRQLAAQYILAKPNLANMVFMME